MGVQQDDTLKSGNIMTQCSYEQSPQKEPDHRSDIDAFHTLVKQDGQQGEVSFGRDMTPGTPSRP